MHSVFISKVHTFSKTLPEILDVVGTATDTTAPWKNRHWVRKHGCTAGSSCCPPQTCHAAAACSVACKLQLTQYSDWFSTVFESHTNIIDAVGLVKGNGRFTSLRGHAFHIFKFFLILDSWFLLSRQQLEDALFGLTLRFFVYRGPDQEKLLYDIDLDVLQSCAQFLLKKELWCCASWPLAALAACRWQGTEW